MRTTEKWRGKKDDSKSFVGFSLSRSYSHAGRQNMPKGVSPPLSLLHCENERTDSELLRSLHSTPLSEQEALALLFGSNFAQLVSQLVGARMKEKRRESCTNNYRAQRRNERRKKERSSPPSLSPFSLKQYCVHMFSRKYELSRFLLVALGWDGEKGRNREEKRSFNFQQFLSSPPKCLWLIFLNLS